jgi:hypothetical protein
MLFILAPAEKIFSTSSYAARVDVAYAMLPGLRQIFVRVKELCAAAAVDDWTPQQIFMLERLLQQAEPSTDHARGIQSGVRGMYHCAPAAYITYLNKRGAPQHLLLWTSPIEVLRHFGLEKKLFVRWDSAACRVSRFR